MISGEVLLSKLTLMSRYLILFNFFIPSNCQSQISTTYCNQENFKKRSYEENRKEIEHSSSMTPFIFSSTGGLCPTAMFFYKWAFSLLGDKQDQHYSTTLGWLRCSSHFPFLEPLSCALRMPGPSSIVWTDQHLPPSTLCLKNHCKMSPFFDFVILCTCPLICLFIISFIIDIFQTKFTYA